MLMHKKQSGFGAVEVIIIVFVLTIIGFASWYFLTSRSKADTTAQKTTSSSNPTEKTNTATPETYKVPDGFTTFESGDYGFKFAYPAKWGELTKTSPALNNLMELETPEFQNGAYYTSGQVRVSIAKRSEFKQIALYQVLDVKPVTADGGYNWQISSVRQGMEDQYKVGDLLSPQPEVIYKNGDLQVYQFKLSHACGEWHELAFPTNRKVGDNFVSLKFPNFCEMAIGENYSRQQGEKALAEYRAVIKQIAQSIRNQ